MCSQVIALNKTACSGKCRAGGCASAPRVWVAAACDGMITLLGKRPGGELVVLPGDEQGIFGSIDDFRRHMESAEAAHQFDQLIVVGSAGDIAWVHSSLPQQAERLITAEIKYPLLSQWFREPPRLPHLTQALNTLMRN